MPVTTSAPVGQKQIIEQPRRPRIHTAWKLLFCVICTLAAIVGTIYGAINGAIIYTREKLEIPKGIELPTLSEVNRGVEIYDRTDHFICTVHADRDTQPVPLSKISKNLRLAVMAAEDRRFLQHHGIDFTGIFRAAWANYHAHRIVEGGSTITQQLARNLFLDKGDRSLTRKLRESFIAWDIETQYSKPKIMETYLNEIYFGDGVNGAERAAMAYFSKHASNLSIAESAYLAGLIRSPSMLGSPSNRGQALARQRDIIHKMRVDALISKEQESQALATKLAFKAGPHKLRYPYYVSSVLQILHEEIGETMWQHDWRVYTNLDPAAQASAQSALDYGIKHAPKGVNQGALVTLSVKDGAVLAMIGGVGGYNNAQWNRALYPHTAGSSFKPFVYLAALAANKIGPNTLIADAPLSIVDPISGVYSPKNFDGKFKGWMPASEALCQSRNVCAVRVAQAVGIRSVIDTARAAGVTSRLDPYISLALGSCAVSPMEMATAYSTLARDGVYMPAKLIRRVESTDGQSKRIFNSDSRQSLPPVAVAQLVQMMQAVVQRGTGTMARLPGIQVAGKTGTADKAKDIWFVGFTPDTVTAVWGGSDLNQEVRGHNVTGGVVMARIWHDYMVAFYKNHPAPKGGFPMPKMPEQDAAGLASRLADPNAHGTEETAAQTERAQGPGAAEAATKTAAPAISQRDSQPEESSDTVSAEPLVEQPAASLVPRAVAASPDPHPTSSQPRVVVQYYGADSNQDSAAMAQRILREAAVREATENRSVEHELHPGASHDSNMTASESEPL